MLTYENLSSTHPDIQKVRQLYEKAFPPEEKLPFEKIYSGKNTALAFYDEHAFVGFVSLLFYQDLLNIVYFAINPRYRSRGYGSRILNILARSYPNHRIYVDVEIEDNRADNAAQRKKRKDFYMKNHFHPADFTYTFNHVTYEVLVNQKSLRSSELMEFWSQFSSPGNRPEIVKKQ